MYKFIISFFVILLSFNVNAQITQGKIIYEKVVQPELPENHENLPTFVLEERMKVDTTNMIMTFSSTLSEFKEEEQNLEFKRRGYSYKYKRGGDKPIYKDLESNSYISQEKIYGKSFIVLDSMPSYQWKMSNHQKKILDYVCIKMTYQDTSMQMEAWFTPQIPLSFSPNRIGSFPGMVLELNINNGETVMTATKIITDIKEEELPQLPKKGKRLSRAEFDDLKTKKEKERKQYSGW